MGIDKAPEDDAVVIPIEGDERFDYKKVDGVSHHEAVEKIDASIDHLKRSLKAREAELVSLQRLQAEGVANPGTVAEKETQIFQITDDIRIAERNAGLAREAAEASTIKGEPVVIPVDWDGVK